MLVHGRAARSGAGRTAGLQGAASGKPEGASSESLLHGGKKCGEREGDALDGDGGAGAELDGEADAKADAAKGERAEVDWLDPSARHAAQLAPPSLGPGGIEPASTASANEPLRGRSLEELIPALVRRIAWAGDRHRGTVRLELGAGAYAGTTVTVHADGGRVRVELGGSEGPELDRLRTRLDARLRGHGLDVESVT
jgi:hypothetical protein